MIEMILLPSLWKTCIDTYIILISKTEAGYSGIVVPQPQIADSRLTSTDESDESEIRYTDDLDAINGSAELSYCYSGLSEPKLPTYVTDYVRMHYPGLLGK